MTHRLPSLFLPKRRTPHSLSFLTLTLHLLVVPLCTRSFSGTIAATRISSLLPSTPFKPLPLSEKKSPLLLSLRLLTQLQQVLLSIYCPCQRQREAHSYRKIPPLLVDTGEWKRGQHCRDSEEKEKRDLDFVFPSWRSSFHSEFNPHWIERADWTVLSRRRPWEDVWNERLKQLRDLYCGSSIATVMPSLARCCLSVVTFRNPHPPAVIRFRVAAVNAEEKKQNNNPDSVKLVCDSPSAQTLYYVKAKSRSKTATITAYTITECVAVQKVRTNSLSFILNETLSGSSSPCQSCQWFANKDCVVSWANTALSLNCSRIRWK